MALNGWPPPTAGTTHGRPLNFDRIPSTSQTYPFMLRDRETGSTWDLKGRAIAGPLKDSVLEQIPGHGAFWFAWITFWQDTEVYAE